jgi:hypothetical protein
LWLTLAEFWGLSTQQSRQAWSALYRARWTTAANWRRVLVHFEGQRPTLRSPERVFAFLAAQVMPETILGVIEGLISEGLLTRREGNAIEERVLRHVGPTGDWAAVKARV